MATLPNSVGDYDVQTSSYVLYDNIGQIIQAGSIAVNLMHLIKGDWNLLYTERTYTPEELAGLYVSEGAVVPKLDFEGVQDSYSFVVNEVVSIAVPEHSTVWMNGQPYPIEEEALELEAVFPMTYELELTNPIYNSKKIEVVIHEA